MALWKKFYLIYTTMRRKHRQIPLVNDYYTVNEWCATFNSHKEMLSVQISKYSSWGLVVCFVTMNSAGYLYREDLLFSFVFFIFTVSKFSKVSKRCKSRNLWTLFENLWNSHSYISTINIQNFYLRIELVKISTIIKFTQGTLRLLFG